MRLLTGAITCLALTGCATTQWHNSNFVSDADMRRQLQIDTGHCRAVSNGAVAMPDVRIYNPGQTRYNVQGTASGYNRQGEYTQYSYSGTATQSSGSSFSQGFAQGMAMGVIARANRERKEVFNACMLQLGWSDTPSEDVPATNDRGPSRFGTAANHMNAGAVSLATTSPSHAASAPAAPASGEPFMIGCGIYSEAHPGQYEGDNPTQITFILDPTTKSIRRASSKEPLTVRTWSEAQIITDTKRRTFGDTVPPLTDYSINVIDRVSGSFMTTAVWRTPEGKILRGKDLEDVAGKHPLWNTLFGIHEARQAEGDCRIVQQRF